MRPQVQPSVEGIPRQDIMPPAQTPHDTRAAEPQEARELRRNRTVAKLKKLRLDASDVTELDAVWATVDALDN